MTDQQALEIDVGRAILAARNDPDYHELQQRFGKTSLLNILGVARLENPHSNFLAWLLDPEQTHGLGRSPMQKFLELLVITLRDIKIPDCAAKLFPMEDCADSIISGAYDIDISTVYVNREEIAKSKKVDIYIEFLFSKEVNGQLVRRWFRIVVENKVGSKEHEEQTMTYWEWANTDSDEPEGKPTPRPGDQVNVVGVYLTPQSNEEFLETGKPLCSNNKFIQITYQGMLDHILHPLSQLEMGYEAKFFIDQYKRSLGYPDTFDRLTPDDIRKGGMIMARDPRDIELIRGFWKKHESLMLAIGVFGVKPYTINYVLHGDGGTFPRIAFNFLFVSRVIRGLAP